MPLDLVRESDPEAARRAQLARKRQRARTARYLLVGLGVAAASILTVLALRPRAVAVDVATTARGPLVVAIEEDGITRVKERYVVSAPVAGSLSRIALDPGDLVAEGQAVASIAPAAAPLLDDRSRSEAEARLGAALASLGRARAQSARATAANELAAQERERAQRLVESGSMTKQLFDQADFEARMRKDELGAATFAERVAVEDVRIARVALDRDQRPPLERHVDVVAPLAARVLRVQQKSAGVVAAGTPLLEIGDPSALEVVVDLLTTDAVQVSPGTEVVIQSWGGGVSIAGRVHRIEPSAFTRPSALGVDEQRVNVLITLIEPRDHWTALGDGFRVEARIVLWKNADVTKVPQGAVFRHGDQWAVFRIVDGRARLTNVTVGHRGDTEVEIISGLAPR